MNRPIVLLTDFGLRDHYAGSLKAVIYTLNPRAVIIDLSHEMGPQNIIQAAFLLKMAYPVFPQGSIFVCVVDPGVGTAREILCVRSKKYYFLAPDNGLLTPVLDCERPLEIRRVRNQKYFFKQTPSPTFHGRDIFSAVAAHLSLNPRVMEKLGDKTRALYSLNLPKVQRSKSAVSGEIIYFDHFGNAMTNIQRDHAAEDFWRGATVEVNGKNLGRIQKTYGTSPKQMVGLFSSSDLLEIAFACGSARDKGRLQVGDQVVVKGGHP